MWEHQNQETREGTDRRGCTDEPGITEERLVMFHPQTEEVTNDFTSEDSPKYTVVPKVVTYLIRAGDDDKQ